jgi:RNA polymerase sigma-70 factor (ECF subfamily)
MMAVMAESAGEATEAAKSASRERELDRQTLLRCTRGDPLAFRAFVVRYERPVFALLSRMLGRGPHVEDLAQETFLRAYKAFPAFDADGAARPSTWLLTIATRLAIDHKRRPTFESEPARALDAIDAGPVPTPEHETARAQMGRAIDETVRTLPDEQRIALVLAELHAMSVEEIARATETPEATVKTRLFRAREKMRAALSRFREGGRS